MSNNGSLVPLLKNAAPKKAETTGGRINHQRSCELVQQGIDDAKVMGRRAGL